VFFCITRARVQGYCVHTLVHSNGLLVPGDTRIGLLKWGSLVLAARSAQALEAVRANPQWSVRIFKPAVPANPG